MRFAVESWAPEYGAPGGEEVAGGADVDIDADLERPLADWAPIRPGGDRAPYGTVAFVDGVRRVDARVWVDGAAGAGLFASWAAGVVTCGERAEVTEVAVERGLFTSAPDAAPVVTRHGDYDLCRVAGEQPEDLVPAVQRRMRELEAVVATDAGAAGAELVVLDGPLANRADLADAVGFIKTHHATYGPERVQATVVALDDGERTPVFVTRGSWNRHSWYLRLPGPRTHDWAGVVRCEAGDRLTRDEVVALADRVAATLPRFASTAHREPRAPQNLTPIAGLEQRLRHRLGDRELLERALRREATG